MQKELSEQQKAETVKAIALHARLLEIKNDKLMIPVMSADRHITRKEQAALARKLFSHFGLKGISVTAPNYSMAQSVDVHQPKREDYEFVGQYDIDENCAARVTNTEVRDMLDAMLADAFPNHDDRSDSQVDHFDYKWSVR